MALPRRKRCGAALGGALVWSLVAAGAAAAQQGVEASFPRVAPEEVGLSSAELSRVVARVEEWVETGRIVGAVLYVMRHGKLALHEAVGWADRERSIRMRPDHIVRMRSMTKPLVGTAILQLAEEGRLELDAPVARYLPSFDRETSREMTVRHLLTHASGLEGGIYTDAEGTPYATLREAVDAVGERGPSFPPGTAYAYSDPGSSTLGALVAELSGMPAETYLERRILEPLGMRDSFLMFDRSDPRAGRVASTYRREGGEWTKYWDNRQPQVLPFFRASGGLYSTAEDYARFLEATKQGGRLGDARILTRASVECMLQPHAASAYSPEERSRLNRFYGFHWMVYTDRYGASTAPVRPGAFEHGGSDGTLGFADPSTGLVVVYLTQSRGTDTRREIVELVHRALLEDG